MSLLDQVAISTLPLVPRPIMRRLSSRYIAGETLEKAVERLRGLAQRGFPGIVDLLGEDVRDEAQARGVARDYEEIAAAMASAELDAYVSVKPTHVGLNISRDLCLELYSQLATTCAARGQFLRVEMEDHPTTDGTLAVFEQLRERHANVGIVLQSRLHRTLADIDAMAADADVSAPLNVRLVKGIYLEPAEIAHTAPDPIRAAYVAMAERLLERGAFCSFATHDGDLADSLIAMVRARKIPADRYEFQVLLGVREQLWERLKTDGHTVRVYVPFGPEWRAYSQRRLRKNPQLFRHILRDTLSFK